WATAVGVGGRSRQASISRRYWSLFALMVFAWCHRNARRRHAQAVDPGQAPRNNAAMILTDLTLRDGRQVHLRATTVADEAEILQGFERLSAHSRYMRLMHVAHEPDVALLRSVLASFPERGVGVVATIPADDGIDIVGSATAVFAPDGAHCEFAVT